MPLSAILITADSAPGLTYASRNSAGKCPLPLACAEIFGRSVLARAVDHLRRQGARVAVIADREIASSLSLGRDVQVRRARNIAEQQAVLNDIFRHWSSRDTAPMLLAQLGAYVEFTIADALQFHNNSGQSITPLHDANGALAYWIVDSARVGSTAELLSTPRPEHESAAGTCLVPYLGARYVNRLTDAQDLRRLVLDAFMGRCAIKPQGSEVRPGIWIDKGVHLHKTARLVAPVYVGHHSTIERSVLLTRFSNLAAALPRGRRERGVSYISPSAHPDWKRTGYLLRHGEWQ